VSVQTTAHAKNYKGEEVKVRLQSFTWGRREAAASYQAWWQYQL
jgi:hypothetical protein